MILDRFFAWFSVLSLTKVSLTQAVFLPRRLDLGKMGLSFLGRSYYIGAQEPCLYGVRPLHHLVQFILTIVQIMKKIAMFCS